jgi:putative hydrolase of the HAD superfamily
MSSIRQVVFDIGRVLVEFDPDRLLAERYADPALRAAIKRDVFSHPDWQELDRGTIDEAAAAEIFHRRTGRPLAEMQALMGAVRRSLVPKPETWMLVRELAGRGVPLYLLSNMCSGHFEFLEARDADWRLFRGKVISGRIGLIKPERAIFEHLLTEHRLIAEETAFIDDHPPNVEMSRALGIRTIHFKDAAQCRRDLAEVLSGGAFALATG